MIHCSALGEKTLLLESSFYVVTYFCVVTQLCYYMYLYTFVFVFFSKKFTCICIHFVLLYPFCCYMETFFVSPMFSVFSVVPLCCYTETFLGHFALIRVFSTQFELFTSHKNDSGIKKSDNNATVMINHEIKLLSLNVLYFWHPVTEGGWSINNLEII